MKPVVVLIEDDESLNYILTHFLEKNNFTVITFTDGIKANKKIFDAKFDIAVIDVNLGKVNGFEILKNIRKQKPEAQSIMITAYANINDAVSAIKLGAYDYLVKPFKEIELVHHIKNAIKSSQLEKENFLLKKELLSYKIQDEIIGESRVIKKLKETIKNVAESDVNVFISGETGTGKELAAKAIHRNSSRGSFPFVPFNCAAIPENLLESELFGYVKGAFTGAVKDKKGKFELADKGTIFLDEIADMPYHLQAKLLRVVQDKEIEPVGSNKKIKIDVRFISSTNKDIEKEINEKHFREDLFYRLSIYPIHLSPLRERKEDIPLLFQHFIKKNQYESIQITKLALKKLIGYPWPGNIRELENAFHYSIVNSKNDTIEESHLPEKIFSASDIKIHTGSKRTLYDYEKEILKQALKNNKGNQTKTAEQLGITRAVLIYKMKKLGVKK